MDEHRINIAEAFSRKSLQYDDFGKDHQNLIYMRNTVRSHVLKNLKPGDRILEINAGTGSDALFFAQSGYYTHATDLSPGMITQIQNKIKQYQIQDKLTVQLCSFTELVRLDRKPFEYVLSNMGGINCHPIPSEIVRSISQVLMPGGTVTWVVMPPTCLWELIQVFRGHSRVATRRLNNEGVVANVEGINFKTYYYSPRQIIQAFGRNFQLLQVQGLSVFTPPADHKEFSDNHKHIYRLLQSLDQRLSGLPPLNRMGDFFIISFKYAPATKSYP
jgi:ubiquinone/menaquinone biosynthesis C-methylase UbiE